MNTTEDEKTRRREMFLRALDKYGVEPGRGGVGRSPSSRWGMGEEDAATAAVSSADASPANTSGALHGCPIVVQLDRIGNSVGTSPCERGSVTVDFTRRVSF